MKKGYKKLLSICLILLVILILNITLNILDKSQYILFLFVFLLGTIIFIGYEKDKYLFKRDIIVVIIISCLFYYILTYAAGLFVGFVKNGYNLTFLSILRNITPYIIIIFLEELIRYNLVKKGSRNILILVLTSIIMILMDITLVIKGFNLNNNYLLIEFLLTHILPSIFKNIFLTYAVYKAGYKVGVIYRMLMTLSLYFMPIFPNLGIYIGSILKIVFPSLLLLIIYKITKYNGDDNVIKKDNYKNFFIPIFIFLFIIMVVLNSGWFKFYCLTIGSGSMNPSIYKGDVIIVKRLKRSELSTLEQGNILVFNKNDKIIVHRIVEIKKINDKYYFYTKGDANMDIDKWVTEEKDVIGTTSFRIMFIGYPSVWLNEILQQ